MNSSTLNLASVLEDSARNYPDKIAVVFNETRLPYKAVNALSNRIANGLKNLGIGKGDRVALSCLNLPYFPIVYYGILKTGATVVPLNVLLKSKEIAFHLQDSEAIAYFCFVGTNELPMGQFGYEGFKEVETCKHFWLITPEGVNSPIEGVQTFYSMMSDNLSFKMEATSPNDPAVILYTSGTTGRPKGAELSHMNMYNNAMISALLFETKSNDIHLVTLPLFHSFGQTVQMNAGFLKANTIVLLARFDPEAVLNAFQNEGVTAFAGVPTMYWALLNYPGADKFDLEKISHTLRLGVSGGSAMPVEVMKNFEAKFNIEILEGYGLSETAPVATFSRQDLPKVPGSIGVPVWGVQVKVIDSENNDVPAGTIGEIVIRGHNIMRGYYKRPEANQEVFIGDGWFKTGDLGKMDEKGYFYIVDRVKEMIIRGGYNVYPREVEEMLLEHEKISLAAVLGEPDNQYGEEIVAYVILKNGMEASPDEIIEWAKNRMASYKYPRRVYIRTELPMTATGKILKRVLKESSGS